MKGDFKKSMKQSGSNKEDQLNNQFQESLVDSLEENTENLNSINEQILELQKKKVQEERKIKLLMQKEEMKRKVIELNLKLGNKKLSCEEREPIYKEIIKTQESLLFINGYYAKILNAELH